MRELYDEDLAEDGRVAYQTELFSQPGHQLDRFHGCVENTGWEYLEGAFGFG